MLELPDQLRIVDGKLVLKDGSDATEYLRAACERGVIKEGEPVNLMRRELAIRTLNDAASYRMLKVTDDERYALAS